MAGSTSQDEVLANTNPRWPQGSVRALLSTDLVRQPTRAALLARLTRLVIESPSSLAEDAFLTLRCVCERLIPQSDRKGREIDVAGSIDKKLAEGKGNGWRYAAMPPDEEAFRRGLAGVDETARTMFGAAFAALDAISQDAVLAAIQAEEAPGATWTTMPARRFFEELLVLATEAYYAHPIAQEEIGYAGMADARAWTRVGLGERGEHEPTSSAAAPFAYVRAAE